MHDKIIGYGVRVWEWDHSAAVYESFIREYDDVVTAHEYFDRVAVCNDTPQIDLEEYHLMGGEIVPVLLERKD